MTDNQGIWLQDEEGQPIFVLYSELDDETRQQLIKPVGGFIFSAENFLALDLPKPPFFIHGWLPKKGKMIIYAPAKSGKSYLCLQIARAIGSGLDVLGRPTIRGRVLYIQFELGEEVLRGRMIETGKSYPEVYVGTSFSLKLDTREGQTQLQRAIASVKPDIVIIDPLYKALIGDENESSDVMAALNFLDAMIQGYDCSVILIHHAGKELAKRARGSSVLEDWADSYIQMARISKDSEPLKVKIKEIYLRHAAPVEPMVAKFENYEFVLEGSSSMSFKQAVMSYFAAVGHPVTPKELLDLKICSNGSLYLILTDLVNEGLIAKVRTGVYELKKGK